MEQTPKILLIAEVADRLRISIATVNRYLALRRKGEGQFPLPISINRGKGRWLSTDIDRYIESQASGNTSVGISTARQAKRDAKAHLQRQTAAQACLERHGINRTQNGR